MFELFLTCILIGLFCGLVAAGDKIPAVDKIINKIIEKLEA